MLHIFVENLRLFEFILAALHDMPQVALIEHPRSKRPPLQVLGKSIEQYLLPAWSGSRYFSGDYLSRLKAIAPQDSVLYFGVENVKELLLLRKWVRARRQSVFFVNPMLDFKGLRLGKRQRGMAALQQAGYEVFTFDPDDAQAFGITLIKHVYRRIDGLRHAQPSTPDRDVLFVGNDKSRYAQLKALQAAFDAQEITSLFHIVKGRGVRYPAVADPALHDAGLPYSEYLQLAQRSACLLEVLQANQSGQTMRSLESAFMNKKLITNNHLIRQTDLYDPARVFLFDDVTPLAGLREFMQRPFDAVSESTLNGYDVRHWCQQFMA